MASITGVQARCARLPARRPAERLAEPVHEPVFEPGARRIASRTRRLLAPLALLSAVVGCAGVSGAGNSAATPGTGRRDERVELGSFATIPAVAVSRRYVYAAGTDGVAIYDRAFNRWSAPLPAEVGRYVAEGGGRMGFLVGDPLQDMVWMGIPGAVLSYRPDTEQLQRTMVTGMPDFIVFDRSGNGDAYVRSAGQYTRISRVGTTFPVSSLPPASSLLVPPTLPDLLRQFPTLRNQPQVFLRGVAPQRALRSANLLAGAASPERVSEVWLGTDSEGLFRFDPTFLQTTPLPYGLMAPGVGGLALAADGVWAASLGIAPLLPSPSGPMAPIGSGRPRDGSARDGSARGGLSFVSNTLQQFRWIDGTIAVPLVGVRSYTLATRGGRAWIGTDRGVVRMALDGDNDTRAWSTLDGLPDARVYSVAPRDDGAWVGTARGLRYVTDSGLSGGGARTASVLRPGAIDALDNVAIHALVQVGDTLWAGTERGLWAIERPLHDGVVLRPIGDDAVLSRPVRALAWSDSVLLAVTDDAVVLVDPRGRRAPERVESLRVPVIAQPIRAGIDARAIWIAGREGVLLQSRAGGTVQWLRSGLDLDGPALDMVASDEWFWIGTTRSLLRLQRTGDGLLP